MSRKVIQKKFSAAVTDFIGQNLVDSLSSLFSGAPGWKIKSQNPFTAAKGLGTSNNKSATPNTDVFDDAEVLDFSDDELGETLKGIFSFEDSKLKLINQRVKQSGKLDHAIRLSILVLYAYQFVERKQVKRADLNEILEFAKVYDGNYRRWMAHCDEISKLNDDLLELSMPGISAAKEILKEIANPSVVKGKVNFSSSSKKTRTKKDEAQGASTKRNNKTNNKDIIMSLKLEGFFDKKRKIGEILTYLKDKKATRIEAKTLSTVLIRAVKDHILKRDKSAADNQYEYYK